MERAVVLFDLDGTLTDPAEGIFNSIRNSLAVLGLAPLTEQRLRRFIGPPLAESFAGLGLGAAGVEAAIAAYREHFSNVGLYENSPYRGIEAAVRELIAAGVRLGVATSKPTIFAERILAHFALDTYFDAVVGSELDGGRVDKYEVIVEALDRLSAPPHAAVMVGDREHDVIGAGRAGMSCIGVAWGYAEPGELAAAGACQILHRPEELSAAVEAHLSCR